MGKGTWIICLIAMLAVLLSTGCKNVREVVADSSIEVIAQPDQDTADRVVEEAVPENKADNLEDKAVKAAEGQRKESKEKKKEESSKKVDSKAVSEKPKTSANTSTNTSTKPIDKAPSEVKDGLKIIDYFLPEGKSEPRTGEITHLMIHFVSNAGAKPKSPYNIKDIYSIFSEYGVSSHYIIDRNGTIYRFVPEDRVAYHAGKGSLPDFPEYDNTLNQYSIGIELLAIGTREEMLRMIPESTFNKIDSSLIGYTDAQYKALKILMEDILKRNPGIKRDRKHIVGHDEYAPDRKTDPGSLFDWSRIGF